MNRKRRRSKETNRHVLRVLLHREQICCTCCPPHRCWCNTASSRHGKTKPRYKDHR